MGGFGVDWGSGVCAEDSPIGTVAGTSLFPDFLAKS